MGVYQDYREVNIDLEPLGSSGCSKKIRQAYHRSGHAHRITLNSRGM